MLKLKTKFFVEYLLQDGRKTPKYVAGLAHVVCHCI
jgi:hypothetical protein